jgi:hypothetical protein
MSTNSKIPLSIGFVLATVSAAAAMSNPGHIRSSQAAATLPAPALQQPMLESCNYGGGPKSALWICHWDVPGGAGNEASN